MSEYSKKYGVMMFPTTTEHETISGDEKITTKETLSNSVLNNIEGEKNKLGDSEDTSCINLNKNAPQIIRTENFNNSIPLVKTNVKDEKCKLSSSENQKLRNSNKTKNLTSVTKKIRAKTMNNLKPFDKTNVKSDKNKIEKFKRIRSTSNNEQKKFRPDSMINGDCVNLKQFLCSKRKYNIKPNIIISNNVWNVLNSSNMKIKPGMKVTLSGSEDEIVSKKEQYLFHKNQI